MTDLRAAAPDAIAPAPPRGGRSVDVVVPCYDYGHFLGGCVESLLSQQDVDVRVLIIDDASPDGSAETARRLAETDARVSVRCHDVNRGHIATYNEGLLGWASASYVALVSADDRLTPGALGRAVDVMEANPSVGMVYGRPLYFSSDDDLPDADAGWRGTKIWEGHRWLADRCRAGHSVISSPEVVVRRSVQQAIGGYLPELPHTGDIEMWLRVAAVADVAHVRGAPQAYYRVHPQSMMRTRFATPISELEQLRAAYDRFFDAHPDVRDADELREAAHVAIARVALWRACRAYDHDAVDASTQSLVDFAAATVEHLDRVPEHRALRRRQRVGAQWCRRTQVFAPTAVARRLREKLWWERWKRFGV